MDQGQTEDLSWTTLLSRLSPLVPLEGNNSSLFKFNRIYLIELLTTNFYYDKCNYLM